MRNLYLAIVLLVAVASTLPAQAPEHGGTNGVSLKQEIRDAKKTTIGPQDTVVIYALNVEELSRAWRINSAGLLNLPIVGTVAVTSMTVDELQDELMRRLAKYVKEPQVSVYVSEFRSNPVTVAGAVKNPGILQIEGPSSLFEVIVKAGGPVEAGPTITVMRPADQGPLGFPGASYAAGQGGSSVVLQTRAVMRGSTPESNLVIIPHDVITVTHNDRPPRVFVTGAVARPGAIELVTQDSILLSEALGLAGGPTSDSKLKEVLIRRRSDAGGTAASSTVNLKDLLAGKAEDISLREGDLVMIPRSSMPVSTMLTTAGVAGVGAAVWAIIASK